jgi:hypothetical protein
MTPGVTAAVQAAAEAQLYAYARMAVALACAAREYDPNSCQARSLACASRKLAVRARASPEPGVGDLTDELATQAECLVGGIPEAAPPDWAKVVQQTVGGVLNALWGVQIVPM